MDASTSCDLIGNSAGPWLLPSALRPIALRSEPLILDCPEFDLQPRLESRHTC